MIEVVHSVKVIITFNFSNGDTYKLSSNKQNGYQYGTYATSISMNEKLYEPDDSNVIGSICCSTFNIELISKDKLLISSNKESPYYGYMNDTCYIDVDCLVNGNEDDKVYMGRYFVDSWQNMTSSSSPYNVSISCVDLLNKIKNIDISDTSIKLNTTFKDYMEIVINKLNSKVSNDLQIKYNEEDINIFNMSGYNWDIYYNNVNRDNIENVFNDISKASLSYIWIDRNRYIKTLCLMDTDESEEVTPLSGLQNIVSYNVDNGDIYNYAGVKVKYIESLNYEYGLIGSLSGISLNKGSNSISVNLDSDKVINIAHIEVLTNNSISGALNINYFTYNKNDVTIEIKSDNIVESVDINIYGTTIIENINYTSGYKNGYTSGSLIEIENNLLRKESIYTYRNALLQLMTLDNNNIVVEGYINPAVKIGDKVSMYGKSLGINGIYRVLSLEYSLGTNYNCRATLIRTVDTVPSVDSLCYNDEIAVRNMITGASIDTYTFQSFDIKNESVVQSQLGYVLNDFNEYLGV